MIAARFFHQRILSGRRLIEKEAAAARKHNAVRGEVRPSDISPVCRSVWKMRLSIPQLTPIRNWISVSTLKIATTTTTARANQMINRFDGRNEKAARQVPKRINFRAVFGAMGISLPKAPVNNRISDAQPKKADAPRKAATAPEIAVASEYCFVRLSLASFTIFHGLARSCGKSCSSTLGAAIGAPLYLM